MKIIEERTRLIFTEYNDLEKRKVEDLVATDDKAFTYEDPDNHIIAFPPGMKPNVKAAFPKIIIEDHTKMFWEFAKIEPVEHEMKPRNQLQVDCIEFILQCAEKKLKVAAIVSPGVGKAVPISTKIPTPNGYKLMGDIKVGDQVFGSSGDITTVLGVFPQGIRDIYKITFSDGRTALCDKDHLWSIYTEGDRYRQRLCTTSEMLKDYKKYTPYNASTGRDPYRYKYRVPLLSDSVAYTHKDVKIHPYVIGALIGGGSLLEKHLTISSKDDFIPKKVSELCGFKLRKGSKDNYSYNFLYQDKFYVQTNEFLKDYINLTDYSYNKYIPDDYLYNDTDTRMELLRGLMDTDGSISYDEGRFHISFTSTSKKLLDQVQQLIWGLGFISNIIENKRKDKYTEQFCGSLRISIPNNFKKKLFSHPRKLEIAELASKRNDYQQPFRHLLIKSIEFSHKEEAQCIYVDAPNHLFLTENFVVTHNTFMACYCAIRVGARTLMIAPTSSIKQQWADTLTDMFNVPSSRVKLVAKPADFINVKCDFVVVSQASLAVLNKTYNLEKIMESNKFGIKIIDEVQMWWHNMIKIDGNSNICHNWYLTGTFGRSGDDENEIYQQMYSDIQMFREKQKKPTLFNRKPGNVYGMKPHMHVKMIWGSSGLSKEAIASCMGSMRYSERAGKWVRYGISVAKHAELIIPSDGTMTKFLKMLLEVMKEAEKHVTYGKTLILGSTINSAEVVAAYARKLFPGKEVYTYHSRNTPQENAEAKERADIMVSTISSAGTGFDWKGLAKLIVFAQYKSWILTDQISGRLRVRDDGKDTYMWDVVDSDIKQLRAWASARADVEKRKSKTFKVVDW